MYRYLIEKVLLPINDHRGTGISAVTFYHEVSEKLKNCYYYCV